jgi:nucleotide-binding universal stress UspA family protein
MNEVSSVLVATDFSKSAQPAVDAAITIAKRFDAQLHVVHALQTPVPIVSPYEVVVPDGSFEQARGAAAASLRSVVEKISSEGLDATTHLTEVPAAAAIVRLAGELDVDLIVVGTRGNTGLKHVLLGSVAERTIRFAPCSVLAVKPKNE